ncbi:hypothetical protein ACOSQ3_025657 [Xanthoceras sorbifolium]
MPLSWGYYTVDMALRYSNRNRNCRGLGSGSDFEPAVLRRFGSSTAGFEPTVPVPKNKKPEPGPGVPVPEPVLNRNLRFRFKTAGSVRTARFEPNRGHLYYTAISLER